MIEIIDGVITIPNWGKHQSLDQLEHKKEYMRKYMQEYRQKQKQLTSSTGSDDLDKINCKTNNKTNVSEADKDIEKDKEEDKNNNIMCATKAQINAFFDSIWQLYPVKKGKGQVSDAKRKALFKIGYAKLKTAIERYQQELAKDAEWRKPQNGSTFFNSGYVDYLDENYSPTPTTTTASNNRAIVNGREYEVRNGKYYVPGGSGIEVNPFAADDLPF
jgi:hypothetical protein